MERDISPLKVLIEKMVKDEIGDIAREIKALVGQTVKASFISQIRESVRNTISETIEEILAGTQEPEISMESLMPLQDTKRNENVIASSKIPHLSLQGVRDEERELRSNLIMGSEQVPQSQLDCHACLGQARNDKEGAFSGDTTRDGDSGGRYLYCIVESNDRLSLGGIGIEGNEVYTIPYKDLAALVHNCPPEPYTSEDSEIVKGWVMVHQEVLERAAQRFGDVIPFGFDTIIKGGNGQGPAQNLEEWLKGDYENLKEKIARFRGKDEYGVQIFWEPKIIGQKIAQTNPEIKRLEEDIKSKPRGMAYMYKQKLEDALKTEMEKATDRYFKEFYEQIKPWVVNLRVEKTKKAEEGKQMLMNLSCLVDKERYKKLGDELEKINNMDGFLVRFTGPWPPYSFV